jgi:hypothetical protein
MAVANNWSKQTSSCVSGAVRGQSLGRRDWIFVAPTRIRWVIRYIRLFQKGNKKRGRTAPIRLHVRTVHTLHWASSACPFTYTHLRVITGNEVVDLRLQTVSQNRRTTIRQFNPSLLPLRRAATRFSFPARTRMPSSLAPSSSACQIVLSLRI